MKKLLFTTLVALSIITSAFADDVTKAKNVAKVNSKAVSNFKNEFETASNVSWTSKTGYTKASFTMNNVKMEAFYDHQGNMIGSSHAICLDDLPTNAKRVFAKRYAGYTVKEAIQFDGIDETAYYISAENETHAVILKVSNGMLSVFKKTSKS